MLFPTKWTLASRYVPYNLKNLSHVLNSTQPETPGMADSQLLPSPTSGNSLTNLLLAPIQGVSSNDYESASVHSGCSVEQPFWIDEQGDTSDTSVRSFTCSEIVLSTNVVSWTFSRDHPTLRTKSRPRLWYRWWKHRRPLHLPLWSTGIIVETTYGAAVLLA